MKRFPKHKPKGFTTTRIIALGFLGAILAGTVLLMLPVSSAAGKMTDWVDALFTATTSVCVTGLVTVPTYAHWSVFGQLIIAILVQIGGLGVITFTTLFLIGLHKKIGLKERLLIQDAYNLDTIQGMVVLVKRVTCGTLTVEGIGALLYMTVLIPKYGASGIWKSIFNAISAFCNAGMDILGPDSLEKYAANPIINITTILLIVLGGIGFPVWWDVLDMVRCRKKNYYNWPMALQHLRLHTKLALAMTAVLLLSGTLAVLILEYTNPETIGNLPLWQKIQASFFQSVTTRTAGFATISQAGMNKATVLICCMLMFIGGSPSGTAGGVKTTTIVILLVTVWAIIRGRKETEMFGRRVDGHIVRHALAIFTVSLLVMLAAVTALSIVQPGDFLDCLYETMSAIATVGLTRDFTPSLNVAGRIVIILTMYIGRIGPISLALLFNSKKYVNLKTYPTEKVSVG